MSRITVIGGTGYAGSAIVAEAAARGHHVTSFSRSLPESPLPEVTYVQGDASDEEAVSEAISGADVVVGAIAPRGALAESYREVYRTIGNLANTEAVPFYIVGGFSSLRPAAGEPRFISDITQVPAELHNELESAAALVAEDLPATPATLDWIFVSPALGFGAHAPGERTGHYRIGEDVAVDPEGGAISGADYAAGFVDTIEQGNHHRAHINLGY
jgi:putative NADH-flavin reductase